LIVVALWLLWLQYTHAAIRQSLCIKCFDSPFDGSVARKYGGSPYGALTRARDASSLVCDLPCLVVKRRQTVLFGISWYHCSSFICRATPGPPFIPAMVGVLKRINACGSWTSLHGLGKYALLGFLAGKVGSILTAMVPLLDFS